MEMDSKSVTDWAEAFLNTSGRSVFLTGKAGTGKTTFLRKFISETNKNIVVAAPTGIAAINAGGVTLHSLFQLPPGIFIPDSSLAEKLRTIRFTAEKKRLLRQLNLLVIDEISMVRADMFDAIDQLLRMLRQQPDTPFGGVQLLMIGDLFQLSPVAKIDEWEILQRYYASPYFFDAKSWTGLSAVTIELTQIFRQSDLEFINLLNGVREGNCSQDQLAIINAHYVPDFTPPENEFYTTLTTHNEKADIINKEKLDKLPGDPFIFKAVVDGIFPQGTAPADESLQLKIGAQVMFIKNDTGEERKYYNGKTAIVEQVSDAGITVRTMEGVQINVQKESWTSVKYEVDGRGQIKPEQTGSFRQFPLKLSWAITIHKSQGLTFEKAVVDADKSFAAGQVYVALSRLTGLDGLILRTPINGPSIITDQSVLKFSASSTVSKGLEGLLEQSRWLYISQLLSERFSFNVVEKKVAELAEKHSGYEKIKFCNQILLECKTVAVKFAKQMDSLFIEIEPDKKKIIDRVGKAKEYFSAKLALVKQELLLLMSTLTKGKGIKQLSREVDDLLTSIALMDKLIADTTRAILDLDTESTPEKITRSLFNISVFFAEIQKPAMNSLLSGDKPGSTAQATLEMHRRGMSVQEIATKRRISTASVEQHLTVFIASGEINITELVDPVKVTRTIQVLAGSPGATPAQVRQQLGTSYSFGEIRFVMEHMKRNNVSDNQPIIRNGNLFAL